MRFHRRSIAGTAARFGTLLLPAALAAATYQWTGTVSDVWSNSSNWSPAGVPASGDDLVFPHNAIRKTTRNNLGNDFRPRSLRFTGATANYVVQGNRIRLSAAAGDTELVHLIDEHTSGNLRFEADLSIAGSLEFQVLGSLGFYGTLTGANLSNVRFTGSGSVETWGPLDGFVPISELPSFTVAGNTENSTIGFIDIEGDAKDLYLARPGGILGWSGDVYVGDASAPARDMTVWPLFENAFGRSLYLSGGGRLVMNDKSQSICGICGPPTPTICAICEICGPPTRCHRRIACLNLEPEHSELPGCSRNTPSSAAGSNPDSRRRLRRNRQRRRASRRASMS